MNLKSMSIDRLTSLRERIEAALSTKVIEQRRALESELAKLTRFQGGTARSKSAFGRGARGKVAPKYRNPDNQSETWAGRGLKPRWLSASIKAGKKLEDFLIEGAAKATRMVRKKARKVHK
jgi:DNA-binding protein H-NS